jgi:uncharacterized protein (TIGR03067 family)
MKLLKERVGIVVLGSALIAITALPAARADDKVDAEREKLQGNWIATSIEADGLKTLGDKAKSFKLVFAGDKVTMAGKNGDTEFSFRLDPTKMPKQLDIETKKDAPTKCIYEFDGKQLKLCMPAKKFGGERPEAFGSDKGMLVILEKKE